MERLTYKGKTKNKVYCEYEMQDAINKLADYEDKQEQGLLIELPCKVGDTVYYLNGRKYIVDFEITGFSVDEDGAWLMWGKHQEDNNTYLYNLESEKLGKTVFLTRSEAEEALAKMGGANESKMG